MSSSAESSSNYSKLHQGKINGLIMKGGATNYDNYLVDTRQQKQKQSQKSEDKLSETRNRKEKKKIHRISREDLVCSMCGDVGIAQFLSLCITCSRRYQHTYCSRDYPRMRSDEGALVCNWCLHEEDAVEGRRKKKKNGGSAACISTAGGHVDAAINHHIVSADADDGGSSKIVSGGGEDSDSGNDIDLRGGVAGGSEPADAAEGVEDRCAATAGDLSGADGGSDTSTDAAAGVMDGDGAVDDPSEEYSEETGPDQHNGCGDGHGMRSRCCSGDRRMITSAGCRQSDHHESVVVSKKQRCWEDVKVPISKHGGTDYYHYTDEDRLGDASSSQLLPQMMMSKNQTQQPHTIAFDYLLKIAAESFPHDDGTPGSSAVAVRAHRHLERNSSVIKKRKIDDAAAAVDRHPVPATAAAAAASVIIDDDNNRAGSINISRKRSVMQRSNYSAPALQQIDDLQQIIRIADDASVKDEEKRHGGSMIARRKSPVIARRAAINLVVTLDAAAAAEDSKIIIQRDETHGTGSRCCTESSSPVSTTSVGNNGACSTTTNNDAVAIDAAAKLSSSSGDGLLTPKSPAPTAYRHARTCTNATPRIKAPRPQINVAPGSDLQRHDMKPNGGSIVKAGMKFSLGPPSSGINSSNHTTLAPTINKIHTKKKKNAAAIHPDSIIEAKHRGGLVKSMRSPSSMSIVVATGGNNIGGHEAEVPTSANKNTNNNKTNNHRNNCNNHNENHRNNDNNKNSSSKFVSKDDSSSRSARSSMKSVRPSALGGTNLSRTSDKINGAIDVESGGAAAGSSSSSSPTCRTTMTTTSSTAVIAIQKAAAAATITGTKKNSKTDRVPPQPQQSLDDDGEQKATNTTPSQQPGLALVYSNSTGGATTASRAKAIADDDWKAEKKTKDGGNEGHEYAAKEEEEDGKQPEPWGSESTSEMMRWVPQYGNSNLGANNLGATFGHVPKRQRCGLNLIRATTTTTTTHHHHCSNNNNGENNCSNSTITSTTPTTIHDIDALHKCRKKTSPHRLFIPPPSSSRPNYRRYKLLADVLC